MTRDGHGVLNRAQGEEIPLPLRIVHVGRDAAYQRLIGGDEHAAEVIRQRAGHAFDPVIANRLADAAADVLAAADASGSAWEATLAVEPRAWLTLEGAAINGALAAVGNFADPVSPSLAGHSSGVAKLAVAAAKVPSLDAWVLEKVGARWRLVDAVTRTSVADDWATGTGLSLSAIESALK